MVAELTFRADEISWVVEQIFEQPTATAETLEKIKPREDITVHRLALFEKCNNVIAIKHNSHP